MSDKITLARRTSFQTAKPIKEDEEPLEEPIEKDQVDFYLIYVCNKCGFEVYVKENNEKQRVNEKCSCGGKFKKYINETFKEIIDSKKKVEEIIIKKKDKERRRIKNDKS
jgi:hypothetical protein